MGTDLDEFGDLNSWVLGAGVGDPGDPNLDPGRRASSAKAWLDGSELPTAPVEGKVPVPKFLM